MKPKWSKNGTKPSTESRIQKTLLNAPTSSCPKFLARALGALLGHNDYTFDYLIRMAPAGRRGLELDAADLQSSEKQAHVLSQGALGNLSQLAVKLSTCG